MTTLFTIGWSKMEPAGLVELLKQHGVEALADIRWKPHSRFKPSFNKNRLEHEDGPLLSEGIGYVHIVELGNEGKDTGTIQLVDEAVGLERLQAEMERGPVAIMCVCFEPESCHRRVVASRMQQRIEGLRIVHLRKAASTALLL